MIELCPPVNQFKKREKTTSDNDVSKIRDHRDILKLDFEAVSAFF